ncbi:allantoate deiminase 2 isoform X4 [Rhododendron vialii]|uniref:allantoate deiminase 2 isoform X4 n=1 Tax=Rhododendron vialii TaxID=182163 RepID=UPI00265FAC91|nr:allantoate deiminase 2 isoform X4 [Rhododendron vialii]
MPSLHHSSPSIKTLSDTQMTMVITHHLPIFSTCFVLSLLSTALSTHLYSGVEDTQGISNDWFPEILRVEAVARLTELGKVSDADGYLERTYLSPASIRAGSLIRGWMEEAGLRTWVDQMGNIHGRVEGMNASSKALLIGSHLDTVIDAGMFDGALGIISALSAMKVLNVNGQLGKLKRPVEVHIEQGPVLESVGLPLGVVKGIAGQTRLKVTVRGSQGHAGTVPMSMRQDPMAAAAELIMLLESLCKHPDDFLSYDGHCKGVTAESLVGSLVCTVGEISCWPSASNVIPGETIFTVDVRAMDNMGREAVIYELSNRMHQICDRRSVSCIIERKHDANAVACDTGLSSQLKSAAYTAMTRMAGEVSDDVPVLMSGAGHDAMAMSHLTKVGMLFVRCRGGISHSPAEHVSDDDVWAAGLAILSFLETQL